MIVLGKSKIAPIAWIALVATFVLALLRVAQVPSVSWWIVPYPLFFYSTYITILLLHGSKLVRYALSNKIKK